MAPEVDLVITFRSSQKTSLSKQQTREDAKRAEEQYSRLLQTLSYAGLRAVGRRGESLGHILVFVKCPDDLVQSLVKRERQSDFLSGLPTTPIKNEAYVPLTSSERLRLMYAYITSIPTDGGLGIIPATSEWDLVESIMCLHDREFNEHWIHAWTTSTVASISDSKIRDQFGDSVALYFSFLNFYTRALIFPAGLGIVFYFFGTPYSPLYSSLLLLWSIVFVEWWRIKERIISLRFGTRGSFRVERRRSQYIPGFSWWKREIRMLANVPVILLFAGVLITLLSGIFVIEAFVTQLYTGPGHKFLAFSPTILFALLVPRLLAVYQAFIQRFTNWENHRHYSTHTASLTLKTFALSCLVAYLGLALSAFIYVPFGEGLMRIVQVWLFQGTPSAYSQADNAFHASLSDETKDNVTRAAADAAGGIWDIDVTSAGRKLNPARLRDQMFAFTVTNQIINTFMEVGLPFIMRKVEAYRNGKKDPASVAGGANGKGKKKVVFEDEKERGGEEEREFLEQVRSQVALPPYELFTDYNEMVTQFGYVALWSTIWPLAPVMSLVNNFFELRSDAFKITVHNRRPIPARTDTIGAWLDALSFLTWLAALTNSALVYLFCPRTQNICTSGNAPLSTLDKVHRHLFTAAGVASAAGDPVGPVGGEALEDGGAATRELLMKALLISLAASHGYMVLRVAVRHLLEKLVWKGSDEVVEREREEREIKETFMKSVLGDAQVGDSKNIKSLVGDGGVRAAVGNAEIADGTGVEFWDHDEGVQEIQRISKEA